jgi:FlaA1/EpsC-like NDP-sugar epimerase
MMESQPVEAIKNNAFGTAQLAHLSYEARVGRFVLISTDKAINPSSVMGATKRVAEVYLQSFQAAHARQTSFISVRFGNVLGSSGSVVPIFEKQISSGGPVRVTHPDVTRYFMTIPEAVGLVLQSACMGEGGEIFLLDMGKPIKIVELAEQMILLTGMRPGTDIQIEFTGLRPGEKLFEELSYIEEILQPTAHSMVYRLRSEAVDFEKYDNLLRGVVRRSSNLSSNELKDELVRLVPEYRP